MNRSNMANRASRASRASRLMAGLALLTGGGVAGFLVAPRAVAQAPVQAAAAPAQVTPRTQQPPEARALSRAFANTAKALQPSVVRIDVETAPAKAGGRRGHPEIPPEMIPFFERFFDSEGGAEPPPGRGTGSGFIIDTAGDIVTNNHVVAEAAKVTVILSDGRSFPARVVGKDRETDVAVVRLEKSPANLVAARMGDSDKLEVGEWALAVGSPLGMAQTVTAGIISGKGRTSFRMPMSGNRVRNYIQTDAKINPGNSGGPLCNLDGEVVGINTQINTGPGGAYGFAIPINEARRVAQLLIKEGRVRYAYLGVKVGDLDVIEAKARDKIKNAPEKAALVSEVTPGSPAEKAGLHPGDLITRIDDQAILGAGDVVGYVSTKAIGNRVAVTYLRDGKAGNTQVTLGELPTEVAVNEAQQERIGLSLQTLTPDLAHGLGLDGSDVRGAVVTDVLRGSRAEKAGLKAEDVIVKVNRKDVRTSEEAVAALQANPKGAQLLQIRRGGTSQFVTIAAQ